MGLLAHNALHDLLICLLDTAHVTTEAILVQLLLGGLVPQAAGIRRDFVCENDLAVRSLAELELKINEDDVQGIEVLLHNLVYLEGHCLDGLDLLTGSSLQCDRVVSVHERVAKLIVFVGELDGRLVEYDALCHAETLRKGTGGNVADDDVFKTVDMYFRGLWDKEKVLDELRYYKMNNQICIVNQETLNRVIAFKRAYEVENNGR